MSANPLIPDSRQDSSQPYQHPRQLRIDVVKAMIDAVITTGEGFKDRNWEHFDTGEEKDHFHAVLDDALLQLLPLIARLPTREREEMMALLAAKQRECAMDCVKTIVK